MIDLDFIKELMTSLIYFHFSLRLVDISDEILNSDVEMSNNENEDKNVIVSEVKAVPTAKKSNNKESKVWKKIVLKKSFMNILLESLHMYPIQGHILYFH